LLTDGEQRYPAATLHRRSLARWPACVTWLESRRT